MNVEERNQEANKQTIDAKDERIVWEWDGHKWIKLQN